MAAFTQAQQGRIATSSRAAARPARYVSALTTCHQQLGACGSSSGPECSGQQQWLLYCMPVALATALHGQLWMCFSSLSNMHQTAVGMAPKAGFAWVQDCGSSNTAAAGAWGCPPCPTCCAFQSKLSGASTLAAAAALTVPALHGLLTSLNLHSTPNPHPLPALFSHAG